MFVRDRSTDPILVNAERLHADLRTLSEFGKEAEGGITRQAYTVQYNRAIKWLGSEMEAAGLLVEIDGAGNLIGRAGGKGSAVAIGSHIDTVPNGGALDGAYGVIVGLECMRRLSEIGSASYPVELIAFADEEGRFIDLLGSRAIAGSLKHSEIKHARDRTGEQLLDVLQANGLTARGVLSSRRTDRSIGCYVELHIEQGPLLERENYDVGVVTTIAGIARCEYRFQGESNHAGATSMHDRKDALHGASRFIDQAYENLRGKDDDTRMTFGALTARPGALNVIPGFASVMQEIRAPDWLQCQAMRTETAEIARQVADAFGLTLQILPLNDDLPVPMDSGLMHQLEASARNLSYSVRRMPSWASHDAQAIAARWPAALVFVPSKDGVSHHPSEFSTPGQLERGANVLLNWLVRAAMVSPRGEPCTGSEATP